eukprot:10349956-Heterocapsa_arctica.AAC.1
METILAETPGGNDAHKARRQSDPLSQGNPLKLSTLGFLGAEGDHAMICGTTSHARRLRRRALSRPDPPPGKRDPLPTPDTTTRADKVAPARGALEEEDTAAGF